jgi:hypothetical protein
VALAPLFVGAIFLTTCESRSGKTDYWSWPRAREERIREHELDIAKLEADKLKGRVVELETENAKLRGDKPTTQPAATVPATAPATQPLIPIEN